VLQALEEISLKTKELNEIEVRLGFRILLNEELCG
jgi:hypothetical protein